MDFMSNMKSLLLHVLIASVLWVSSGESGVPPPPTSESSSGEPVAPPTSTTTDPSIMITPASPTRESPQNVSPSNKPALTPPIESVAPPTLGSTVSPITESTTPTVGFTTTPTVAFITTPTAESTTTPMAESTTTLTVESTTTVKSTTTPTAESTTTPTVESTTTPTAESTASPVKICYKKAYQWSSPVTTCKAKSFGCYETERFRHNPRVYGEHRDIRMGCLNKPCKPIDPVDTDYSLARQCCNTSLCNNLHEPQRTSLFDTQQMPTLDPSLDGFIWCYSEKHRRSKCKSNIGCFTSLHTPIEVPFIERYHLPNFGETVVNRSCIDEAVAHRCLWRAGWKDSNGDRAECCFNFDFCNRPVFELSSPRNRRGTEESTAAQNKSGIMTESLEHSTDTPTNEPSPAEIDMFTIAAISMGAVTLAAIILSVVVGLVFYLVKRRTKQATQALAAPRPPPFVPPPQQIIPGESITLPVAEIRV